MHQFNGLKNTVWEFRYRLALTYTLFSLETFGLLMRPYFLGEAVNDLMKGSYHGLTILVAQHVVWLTIGTIRHRVDTRTYTKIYTELVIKILARSKGNAADVSKLAAHSTLTREFIDFLEYDLSYVLEAIYNLMGSLVLLYFYEHKLVIVCLIALVPVGILSYWYGKRMLHLNKNKNDELEQQVSVITENDAPKIRQHYLNLRHWQVKISDEEALNFGLMEIIVIIVIAISLLLTAKTPGQEPILAGDIIGIYNYILKFVSGLDTIPYIGQRLGSLNDIAQRMSMENDE